jgi:two-component system chemotaxis response regulator CheY
MTTAKSCLIVDDSELIREIAVRIVVDLGLDADGVEDAPQAIEYCRDKRPAVVFLDWDLPSMGALDFLRGVSALEGAEKPAIVLCATENDHQQFTLARAAGAAHHILKPFDKAVVAAKLAEIGLIDGAAVISATAAKG